MEVCIKKGLILKNIADKFWVEIDSKVFVCASRKNLKKSRLLVGDKVEVLEANGEFNIEKVLLRKNDLIRPPLANLDILFIVVASKPEPDFAVLDKLLLFCFSKNIEPIIVVNKQDLDSSLYEKVVAVYQNVCQTLCVSSKSGYNIDKLRVAMKGAICAFAGQSAVGKSSLINALAPELNLTIGELSQRIERGKNTTTHCNLCKLDDNTYLCDTPGFSLLDEYYLPIKYDELSSFYPEYVNLASSCKFKNTCDHIHEKEGDCAVLKAVQAKDLDVERYSRYKQIYENLKNRWKNEHR